MFEPAESELAESAGLLRAFHAAAKRRRRHESGGAAEARSRSKASARDYERGRYVKAEFPRGGVIKRIAVDATLRAAAMHQRSRRRRRGVEAGSPDARRVWIEKDDLRVKRMSRKAGVLTVFAVDASGSMALHRAAVAKGAALTLLEAAHKRRDSVAVVSYGGAFATTLLPPSRAPALARARLAAIPSGGGTPLAHGLVTAGRVAHDATKFRGAVASAKVVLLTDGGANVLLETSLAAERRARDAGASAEEDTTRRKDDASETSQKRVSVTSEVVPSKAALRSEALAIAALIIKRSGARMLVVDASRRFERAEPEKSAVGKDPATESLPRARARARARRVLPPRAHGGREARGGDARGGRRRVKSADAAGKTPGGRVSGRDATRGGVKRYAYGSSKNAQNPVQNFRFSRKTGKTLASASLLEISFRDCVRPIAWPLSGVS